MRLRSARVRNYRIHRDLTVEFDPHRTLIAGDNESGKSTLVEAIHRALFLKATVTGDVLAGMRSRLHSGHPEVELRFTVGEHVYHLRKRFSGQNGTVTLSRIGGETWQGEEAEARLAALLGVEPTGGGRGIDKRLQAQWAHLWVWQGVGGEDPARYAKTQQHRLLQQLQRVGGAVAMQSALDGHVAEHFARLHGAMFTKSGKPKAGSALAAAEAEHERAGERLRQAEARLARLETAMNTFEKAGEAIRRAKAVLADARQKHQETTEKLEKLENLRQQAEAKRRELATIQDGLTAVEEADRKIGECQAQIRRLQEALAPLRRQLADKEQSLADLKRHLERARQAHQESKDRAVKTRRMRDLAVACERVLEAGRQYRALARQVAEIERHEREIQAYQEQLARLPAVTREALDRIERLDRDLGKAQVALAAAAPVIEILQTPRPIRIGERELSPGERLSVTETAELTAGDTRLRIHPGGGEGLAALRERIAALEEAIREALGAWGLASLDEAAAVVLERRTIQQEIERLQAALAALNPASTREQFEKAKLHRTATEAELDRLQQAAGGESVPEDLEAARRQVRQAQQRVDDAEAEEREAAGDLAALTAQAEQVIRERDRLEKSLQEQAGVLRDLETTLRVLVEQAGDETRRHLERQRLLESKQAAARQLEEIHTAITELQPDLLEADKERLERVIRNAEDTIREAEPRRAAAKALLQSDGNEDPHAELARARADFAAAEERLQAERRHAEAVALVHGLFKTQQRELSEHFSQPLAETITTYLRPALGPGARAVARFDGNEFTGVELVRPPMEGTLAFDALSGGTREQVAAAVRLAIAELLAAEGDGTLPVVFDDAFVNSDPRRIARLQRTLDLGARRGLQIIVLTCHSDYYTELGARQVFLEPAGAAILGR